MKKSLLFLIAIALGAILFVQNANAQVDVTATAGTPGPTTYSTLKLAFDAVNSGTHQGAITISITANTTEGTTPATLNSTGAGSAVYTSVLIRPTADGVSISGNPVTGFGVIQLKGADYVTIDGDNPNTSGINRNLTVNNTTTTTVIANSVIRIATSLAVTSADNNTIKNCNLNGNVTGGNISTITSSSGSSNSSFGIFCGGNGGATVTDPPTALTSVTSNTAPAGTTINSLTIDNNAINQCARAIVFNGAAASVSLGTLTITNNVIGAAGTQSGNPPFTTPSTTVYTKGIWMNGLTAATVTGNTLQNVMSYVGTTITGIETVGSIGTGLMTITGNTLTTIANNASSSCLSITLTSSSGTYNISSNVLSGIWAAGSTCSGINCATSATSGTISSNKITTVRGRSTGGNFARGIVVSSGSAVTIQNNFISDVLNIGNASFGNSFNANGILLSGGSNHKVYHNSVNLYGVSASIGSNSINCLSISANTQTGIDVRNNIFSNTVTGGAATDAHCCIFLPFAASGTMNLTLNNNAYFTGSIAAKSGVAYAGSSSYVAANVFSAANFDPTQVTPATNFRSFSSALGVATNDNSSYASTSAAPFLSPTNLHLDLSSAQIINVERKGASGLGVTTDIDGDARPDGATLYPDMGGDEVVNPTCSTADGGTISPGTAGSCVGLTYAMTSAGATSGVGITYQWEVSITDGLSNFNDVTGGSGANTPSYTTGVLTLGTYYYRLKVVCSFGPVTGYSNVLTLTVNSLPAVSVDPVSAAICQPGGSAVTLTADGALTYAWSPATGLTPNTGATVSANPAATTTYTVTGTDVNGCTNTATSVITIGAAVTMSSVTAAPASVCSGGSTTLTAVASSASSAVYCVGPYTTGTGFGDYILNVTLGSINNSTGASASPYNTYYNLLSTNLSAGAGYTLTGSVADGGTEGVAAWIDYNQDGTFDAVEKLGEYTGLSYSIPFTVPGTVLNGTTRLRVRNVYSTTGILPCNSYSYGEIEDYNVVISGGTDVLTYAWSESPANSTLTSTTGNPAYATNIAVSATYTVTATAPSGCSATGNVLVPVGAELVCTDITYTPACDMVDFTVTANSTGGGGTLHYAWSDGKGGVYPDAKTITANMATETYEFSVTITDDCGGTCDLVQTIVVGTPPGGTANGPANGLTYVNMLYAVTGYEAGATFQWQVSTTDCSSGFAPIPGSVTDEVTLFSNAAGTFYINCVVTGANGCITTTNCITTVVAVNGDNVCSAIPLSMGNNGPYTNVGATTQAGEPVPPATGSTTQTGWDSGQTISNTIWFSFVAPASGRISVENNPFLNRWDNQFAVYSAADCGSILTGGATLLAANDDSTLSTPPYKAWIAPICLTPGVTYYLQIDGWGTTTNANWGINLKDAGNAAPVISGCPSDIIIPANAAGCTADVPWTAPTASDPDNCISPLSFTSNFDPGDNFPLGETTVTYTANDGVNTPVTCSFKVTVVNTTVAGITGNLEICDTHSNVLDAGSFAGYYWSTGETTQTISVSTAGTYTVTVTDANGCTASASATTTIIPSPTAFTVAGGGSYCDGGTGVFIFLTGSELNVNYELWLNGFSTGTIIPGTNCCGIAFPDVLEPGVYTIVGTSTTNGCTMEMTGSVTVIVDPVPSPTLVVDGTSPICAGESSNITVAASEFGAMYQLRNNTDNSLVGAAVPGDGGTILLPTGPVTSTTTFNVLATFPSTGCTSQLTATFTVEVNPLPEIGLLVGVTGGQVCAGSGTSLSVALSVIGTSYQLRDDYSNSPIGLPVAGDGGTILLPTGPLYNTNTFNILATIDATGCSAQLTAEATVVAVASGPVTTIPGVHVCTGATTVDIPVKVSSFSNVGSFSLTFGFTPTELRAPRIISRNAAFDLAGHVWPEFDSTTNAAILATGTYKVSGLGVDPLDGVTLGPDETLFTLRFNIVSGTTYSDITFKEDVQGTACEYTGVAYDYAPFCDTPTGTFYIPGSFTMNPLGQVEAVSDQVVCNDALTTTVTFTTTNVVGTTTYDWTNDAPGIGLEASGSGNILAFTAINTGTAPVIATITVTPTLTDGEVGCVGTPVSFTITVNPSGQVNDPDDQVVCVGSSTTLVTFTTNNTGGTTTFTWTNDETGIGLVAEGTGDIVAFTSTNTTTSPLVATITVTPHFSNSAVSCDGTPQTFTITVNPLGQVNNPGDVVICNGELTGLISFTTNNLVGTTTYSWTNDDTSIGLDANGTGDILAFTASNTTNAPVVAEIIVTPHFTYGLVTCDGVAETFTITVNPTGQVNDPDDQLVCDNSPTTAVTFGTTNTVGTTTYTWLNNAASIGLGASGSGNIDSFTATNTTTAPVIATITVTPHFENASVTCDGEEQTFTITVNPAGQVNNPGDQVLCVGENTALVTFGSENTGGTTTYIWSNSNTNIGLASNGTGDIASFVTLNTGTAPEVASITVTPTFENGSVSCEGTDEVFTITVNPAGQVNISVASQVLCNNTLTTPVAFTTNNTVGTTTYTWTNNTTSIGLGASGSGNIPAFTATNTTTAPVLATITVTPHFEYGSVSCTGTSKTLTILVNPTGQVNTVDNQLLCNGAQTLAVTFTTTNTGGSTIYAWTNNAPGIGLAAAGSGDISAFTAINTGTAPVVATITVTPIFTIPVKGTMSPGIGGCPGTPITFTITVNPAAQMNQPADQTVSNGSSTAAVNFTSTNSGGTTTYAWTNNTTSIGLGSSGTGNIASFTAINSTINPVVATIIVTPTFTNGAVSCPGPPKTFTITVNPKPILVITNQAVCSPHKVNLTLPAVTAGSFLPSVTVLSYFYDAAALNPIAVPTSVGNGTYYIKATITPGGWYDIKPVVATVNPLPTIYSGVPSSATICSAGPGIAVGISGSQIGVNYSLWVGLTQVSTITPGTGFPISFSPAITAAGNYWVLAQNVNTNCITRMYNCIDIFTTPALTVTVSITTPTTTVIADQNVTFTATPVNGGVTPSYQWKVNGFNVGGNSPTYTYKPVNGDAVTCVLTSSVSCVSGPGTSNTLNMTVTGVGVNITVTGGVVNGVTRCYNASQTLTVAGGGTTFVVNSGGSATMIAGQNIIYLPGTTVVPGGYMWGYISTTYCGTKSPAIVATPTGDDELPAISQKTAFKIYPNPTTGNFTLEQTSGTQFQVVNVEIYSMRGGKVMTRQLTGDKKHDFSISEFPAGLYFVKVVAGEDAETLKLIKTN